MVAVKKGSKARRSSQKLYQTRFRPVFLEALMDAKLNLNSFQATSPCVKIDLVTDEWANWFYPCPRYPGFLFREALS